MHGTIRPTGLGLGRHGTTTTCRALGHAWASLEASHASTTRHIEVICQANTTRHGPKPIVPSCAGTARLPAPPRLPTRALATHNTHTAGVFHHLFVSHEISLSHPPIMWRDLMGGI